MYERLTKRFLGSNAPYTEFLDYNELLNRLAEIEDKICEGKMLELPCKIGEEKWVYSRNNGSICKGKVIMVAFDKANNCLVDMYFKYFYEQFEPDELFDTAEEAENALKESRK